jgi:hypothetical protein
MEGNKEKKPDRWGATAKAQAERIEEESRRGKGPCQRDVEKKLAEAIEIGVRSSGKPETRQYRVMYYTGRLAKAKLEVEFFEGMLRLEEAMEDIPGRYDRESLDLEEKLRKLKLKARVATAQGRVDIQEYETQTQLDPDEDPELAGEPDSDEGTRQGDEEWDTTLVKKEEVEPYVEPMWMHGKKVQSLLHVCVCKRPTASGAQG